MIAINDSVYFVSQDNADEQNLCQAIIEEASKRQYAAVFQDDAPRLEEGNEVEVLYTFERMFSQQTAKIISTDNSGPQFRITFMTIGEPVFAEKRNEIRISSVMANILSSIGQEDECPILDIGNSGFSASSETEYSIGSIHDVVVHDDDQTYTGKARIQSIKPLRGGKKRYGFMTIDDNSNHALKKGLQKISVAIQRAQARRVAGKD